MKIKLGQKVKDKMTGFVGTVDHIATYLYDSVKIGIQAPIDKDGKFGDCVGVDAIGVEIIEEKPVVDAIPSTPKYSLGSKAKCNVTGFEGTIVAYVQYINGCVHYRVQPKMPKGGKADDYTAEKFPEGSLEVKEPKKKPVPHKTGGPREIIPRRKSEK